MAHPIVLIGLSIYLAVMLGVGLYASRRIAGSADFIVAGKRLSLLLCTATLAATWFGGGICIGAASAAYEGGFLAVIADPFGAALCLFLAGLFYVRLMRRMGLMTVASFFTARFNRHAGLLASLCTIPAYVGWVGSLMVAFGRILQSLTGLDPHTGILIAAVIVLIYTFAGGMWAVTLTDFLQVVILIVGLLILTPLLLHDMGGWSVLAAQIPEDRFHFYPRGGASSWFAYARDWLVIGLGNLAGQDLIQRSLSSRNEKVAYRSAYLAGLLYISIGLLPVLLGMAGSVILPELADPDLVMMELALIYLPEIALVLFMGALVSALLSSADSALLAPASVIGWDLLRWLVHQIRETKSWLKRITISTSRPEPPPFLPRILFILPWVTWIIRVLLRMILKGLISVLPDPKPEPGERASLLVSRLAIVVLGIASLFLALYKTTVYELMVDSWSVLLASLFVPLTAGLWWPRANAPGAVAAILAGLAAWRVLLVAAPELPADLMAVPFAALVLISVSLLTGGQFPSRPLSDENGARLPYRNRLGTTLFDKP